MARHPRDAVRVPCPFCRRFFLRVGLKDHITAKHCLPVGAGSP